MSIDLPAGKTLALVGASGCGKSTFIYLIERFYDCQGGSILIDNMDILKYDPQWLRDQVPPSPACALSVRFLSPLLLTDSFQGER